MRIYRQLPLVTKAALVVGVFLLAWIVFWGILSYNVTGPSQEFNIAEVGTVVSQFTPTPTP